MQINRYFYYWYGHFNNYCFNLVVKMDITFLFKIAGIGLIVAVLQQMLSKAGREEFATLTVLTGIIVIIAMMVPQLTSVFDEIKSIFNL